MSQPHARRNTLLALAAFITLALTIAACGTKTAAPKPAAVTPPASAAAAQAPASSAPAPSPTPVPPTKVTFTVTGYAPGDGYGNGPTVNYGSSSDTREASLASIDGTLTYTMPYDGTAEYYSLNAQLAGSGHLTCKIVVTGPYPDAPLTVSHGSASGGYSVCSAQAAPSDPSGLNWQDEQ